MEFKLGISNKNFTQSTQRIRKDRKACSDWNRMLFASFASSELVEEFAPFA